MKHDVTKENSMRDGLNELLRRMYILKHIMLLAADSASELLRKQHKISIAY